MRSTERDASSGASMIARVAAILDAFTEADDVLGVSEIARRTGLPKATCSRIVEALVDSRFLERQDRRLRLGIRLFELGESAARPRDLRRAAVASMADLRAAVGHTVHLAVREGTEVVYLEILPARGTPALPSRVGGRMPMLRTAVGKALVASLPEAERKKIVATVDPEVRDLVTRELDEVLRTGIAYENEESAPGVACAASVITSRSGDAVAAISASGWVEDFAPERVGPAVSTAAKFISRLVSSRSDLRI